MQSSSKSYWVELLGVDTLQLEGRYTTRIVKAGAGEPLILLHGTGGHIENYACNIAPLAKHFRVIAMDFLWHGRSQTADFDPEIMPMLVDQILDVIDTLGLAKVHIEGQSLGGWAAAQFALRHPDRTAKLVLTNPMGFIPEPGSVPGYEPQDGKALRESNLNTLQNPTMENIRTRLERIVWDRSLISDEAVRVRHAFYNDTALNAVQQEFMQEYPDGAGIQRHIITETVAAQIQAETLVYWGEKNQTPVSVGERLSSVIPNSRFYCAPNTGHWAQFENFHLHNQEVTAFLQGDNGSAGAHAATVAVAGAS
jgi:2-hydroxy-6-oxonona-2,4-dienedioate hydrolase